MPKNSHHTAANPCPCSCHGRGMGAPCDPQFPAGCGQGAAGNGCPGCDQPVKDGALCTPCTTSLRSHLGDVPWLAAELEITRAKQDRMGDPGPRSHSVEVPLGCRPAATEVADVLHGTLAWWARELAQWARLPLLDIPAEHPASPAKWLTTRLELVRHFPEVGEMMTQVRLAVRDTRRTIDRPADKVYAGPCDDCGEDLYSRPQGDTVQCPGCGALYQVQTRREWLLQSLREHLATASEISLGVGELYGEKVNRSTIRSWHHRDRLASRGTNRDGWQLFRIGDVLELAEQALARANTAGQVAKKTGSCNSAI